MLEHQLPAPTPRLCLSVASTDTQVTLSSTFLLSTPSSFQTWAFMFMFSQSPHTHFHPGEHKLQEGELNFHLVFLPVSSLAVSEPRTDHRSLGKACSFSMLWTKHWANTNCSFAKSLCFQMGAALSARKPMSCPV